MGEGNLPFEDIFGSDENDGMMLSDVHEQNLAKFIYTEALKEPKSDGTVTEDGTSTEVTMKKIQEVVCEFTRAGKKRENFLAAFEKCGPIIIELIELLEKLSNAVESTKKWIKITQILAAIVGALAGIAVFFACPPVAAPAALAISGIVVGGSCIKEHYYMKSKVEEANDLIKKIEEEFKKMEDFLELPEKLKKSFESLIDVKVLSEINEDVKQFFNKIFKEAKLTVREFKEQFKEELQKWMKKMSMDSKISGLDDEMRPIVKTFLVVSLIKSRNRLVLNSVSATLSCVFGTTGLVDVVPIVGDFLVGAEGAGEMCGANFLKFLAPVAVILNAVVLFQASKQLSETSKLAREINGKVQQFKNSYFSLGNLCNQLKEIKFIHDADVIEWDTVLVLSVPLDAQQVDIKRAVKPYLLKEAHACIKLEKLQMIGNNWNVKVPKTHSKQLLQQSEILIKETSCKLII